MTVAATPATVAVAFSGGRDSLALLHATCRAAQALGLKVVALHVHHGLLPEADAWLRRAQALCARWRRKGWPLQLRWSRLSGQPAPCESLEAWARNGRYAALAQMAGEAGASLVLLAHHRRDQAETVLLQALRGGGPAGLSAMPASAQRAGLTWARPWLRQPHAAIEAYVRRHRLQPVLDPSNSDPALARSRLRQQVWPALTAAFADAEATLAAAAVRAQEAAAALAELAAIDLAGCIDAQGRLQVRPWRQLSAARQVNALRAWWRSQTGRGAPETLVARLLAEVPSRGAASWPAGEGGRCVLHRGMLQWVAHAQPRAAPAAAATLDLSRAGRWPAPGWHGAFVVAPVAQGGIAPALLAQVALRARRGGERFQFGPRSLPRSLKKQYQAAGVPVFERDGPLLWAGDGRLLFVPGLGLDARCHAAPGEPQLALQWQPSRAPAD
jgi:tRNA(Ile)-lysidine synthase